MKANKKYQFSSEKEFVIGAGMIGLAYGIIEKLATGNFIAIVLGIIFPMHIIWQMNQGRHFYKYKKAKEENNIKIAKRELFLATFMTFLIHGCWDALISLTGFLANKSNTANADLLGGVLLLFTILFGLIYIIASIVKTKKALNN